MGDWLQSQIVSLVWVIVLLGIFGLAIFAGAIASGANKFVGWVVGIVVLIFLVWLTMPLMDSLSRTACGLNVNKCQ